LASRNFLDSYRDYENKPGSETRETKLYIELQKDIKKAIKISNLIYAFL
jgi:hypothetical protein